MSQLEIVVQVCGAEEERRRESDEHGARQALCEEKRDGRAVDEFLGERPDRVVAQRDPLAVRLRRGAYSEHERVVQQVNAQLLVVYNTQVHEGREHLRGGL